MSATVRGVGSEKGPAAASQPSGVISKRLASTARKILGLLVAVAGEVLEPLEEVFAGSGLGPDSGGVAVVVVHEVAGQILGPAGHRTGEPVQRGLLLERGLGLLGIQHGKAFSREVVGDPLLQPAGAT